MDGDYTRKLKRVMQSVCDRLLKGMAPLDARREVLRAMGRLVREEWADQLRVAAQLYDAAQRSLHLFSDAVELRGSLRSKAECLEATLSDVEWGIDEVTHYLFANDAGTLGTNRTKEGFCEHIIRNKIARAADAMTQSLPTGSGISVQRDFREGLHKLAVRGGEKLAKTGKADRMIVPPTPLANPVQAHEEL